MCTMCDVYHSQCLYFSVYLYRHVYVCRVRAEIGLHKFGTARTMFVHIALSGNWNQKQFCCDEWKPVETTLSMAPAPSVAMNLLYFVF